MSAQRSTVPGSTKPLRSLSDIRRFFYRNETPVYFISATNFNLLGADEWVRSFKFISYIDCFDGQHPGVFVPEEISHEAFGSIEDINKLATGSASPLSSGTSWSSAKMSRRPRRYCGVSPPTCPTT
jgi:hypothetical protein